MTKFISYIVFSVLVLIVALFLLDLVYTNIYISHELDSKVSWARNTKHKDFDYVIVGSSRAYHSLDAKLINDSTDQNGINLSCSGFHPYEMFLIVNSIYNNNDIKLLFLQVDEKYSVKESSNVGIIDFVPFLTDGSIECNNFDDLADRMILKIPFCRYIKFGSKLGIRRIAKILLGKGNSSMERDGFLPILSDNHLFIDTIVNPQIAKNGSVWIDKIVALCEKNDTKIVYFTSPYYNVKEGTFDVFSNKFDPYYNFSNVIRDSSYYFDNKHLNLEGAILFSNFFYKKLEEDNIFSSCESYENASIHN